MQPAEQFYIPLTLSSEETVIIKFTIAVTREGKRDESHFNH